ncbi:MAG: hypothetical protein IT427_02035, partial [Pirellulales bacterium]|nr:hypothetical protein [Pirellulales bacterium]
MNNRLDDDGTYTYEYDGEGNLIKRTETSSGDDLLLTRDSAGAATHRYLNGPLVDQVLADDKLVSNSGGSARVQWPLSDEQQTPRKL